MTTAQPTDANGPTGHLCSWLSSLTLSDVLETVKIRAKYLILDDVGCALNSAHLPISSLLRLYSIRSGLRSRRLVLGLIVLGAEISSSVRLWNLSRANILKLVRESSQASV